MTQGSLSNGQIHASIDYFQTLYLLGFSVLWISIFVTIKIHCLYNLRIVPFFIVFAYGFDDVFWLITN